jgi:hypothetical protein
MSGGALIHRRAAESTEIFLFTGELTKGIYSVLKRWCRVELEQAVLLRAIFGASKNRRAELS